MANDSLLVTIPEFISILSDLLKATAEESCFTPNASTSSWSVISAGSDIDLDTSPTTLPPSTCEETRMRFKRDLTWDGRKETEPRSRKARDRRQRRFAKEEEWAWIDHGEEEEVLDSWVDPEYAAERERQRLAWNDAVAASNA